VALIGDGGLQFTLPELAAGVEAQVPVILLLWNNQGYGEIKTYMAEKSIPQIGVDIFTPDFVAIAQGFGCAAERADSLEHLKKALETAVRRAVPTLIEIRENAPWLTA
jgi:acetolactate synthase I/II/III large subunit